MLQNKSTSFLGVVMPIDINREIPEVLKILNDLEQRLISMGFDDEAELIQYIRNVITARRILIPFSKEKFFNVLNALNQANEAAAAPSRSMPVQGLQPTIILASSLPNSSSRPAYIQRLDEELRHLRGYHAQYEYAYERATASTVEIVRTLRSSSGNDDKHIPMPTNPQSRSVTTTATSQQSSVVENKKPWYARAWNYVCKKKKSIAAILLGVGAIIGGALLISSGVGAGPGILLIFFGSPFFIAGVASFPSAGDREEPYRTAEPAALPPPVIVRGTTVFGLSPRVHVRAAKQGQNRTHAGTTSSSSRAGTAFSHSFMRAQAQQQVQTNSSSNNNDISHLVAHRVIR
jgi:hypothetical protein